MTSYSVLYYFKESAPVVLPALILVIFAIIFIISLIKHTKKKYGILQDE